MLLRHSSLLVCLALHLTYQLGQIHFRLPCLKAALHRGLRQHLKLSRARALQEEIRIAPDILDSRKRQCVKPALLPRHGRQPETSRSDEPAI